MRAIIGDSAWAQTIRRVAKYRSSVSIVGPSGTGKELIAGAIHAESPRAADGGTIFLDEIGELSLELQAQLLHVIQQRAVTPVGSHRSIPVDVRLITATNRQLSQEVAAGRFRLDLYYRLNVVKLTTVPLCERPEDVTPLCRYFLDRLSIENGPARKRLSAAALRLLAACDWPGNVRQLQNVLERAVVFVDTAEISAEHLRALLEADSLPTVAGHVDDFDHLREAPTHLGERGGIAGPAGLPRAKHPWLTLAEAECRLIQKTLDHTFYNQSAAARLLHVDRRLLARKIRKYGLLSGRYHARSAWSGKRVESRGGAVG